MTTPKPNYAKLRKADLIELLLDRDFDLEEVPKLFANAVEHHTHRMEALEALRAIQNAFAALLDECSTVSQADESLVMHNARMALHDVTTTVEALDNTCPPEPDEVWTP